jgi:hypothetical protein
MKTCKACGTKFEPVRSMQVVCSPACALAWAKQGKGKQSAEKVLRAVTRERKAALRTIPELTKIAQAAFNRYIRARDTGKPCICCQRPLNAPGVGGGFDAGHYRSVGSAPHLRFSENNCHGQSKYCNQYRAGNAADYRIGLIARIGLAEVEALEADQAPRKYTRDELIQIAQTYRAKAREIERGER